MKTICFIALISLAVSTTFAESNLRKENQIRLTQELDFPEVEAVEMEVYMDPEFMYYYIKNEYDHYEFECVKPVLYAMYIQEQYKAYKEMNVGTIEQMIMKYTNQPNRCFYFEEFLDAYNGLHLGGV